MSASKKAKAIGFKNLKEVAAIFDCNADTLHKYNKSNPDKLEIILLGCKAFAEKREEVQVSIAQIIQ